MSRRSWLRFAKTWPKNWRPLASGVPQSPHSWDAHLAHVALWFHALSDIRRLHIVELLSARDRYVTELSVMTEMPHSSVVFHLKVLRESGVIAEYRVGRKKYFNIQKETLAHMAEITRRFHPEEHRAICPMNCCRETPFASFATQNYYVLDSAAPG